jgi:hypothetical protein
LPAFDSGVDEIYHLGTSFAPNIKQKKTAFAVFCKKFNLT